MSQVYQLEKGWEFHSKASKEIKGSSTYQLHLARMCLAQGQATIVLWTIAVYLSYLSTFVVLSNTMSLMGSWEYRDLLFCVYLNIEISVSGCIVFG